MTVNTPLLTNCYFMSDSCRKLSVAGFNLVCLLLNLFNLITIIQQLTDFMFSFHLTSWVVIFIFVCLLFYCSCFSTIFTGLYNCCSFSLLPPPKVNLTNEHLPSLTGLLFSLHISVH